MNTDVYGKESDALRLKAESCLNELSFAADGLGRIYLVSALELVARRPELGRNLNTHLYPYLASLFGTKSLCVERNIRYAIESAWSRCRPEIAERYFGYSTHPDKGKPTNREFIVQAAERIRLRYEAEKERQL